MTCVTMFVLHWWFILLHLKYAKIEPGNYSIMYIIRSTFYCMTLLMKSSSINCTFYLEKYYYWKEEFKNWALLRKENKKRFYLQYKKKINIPLHILIDITKKIFLNYFSIIYFRVHKTVKKIIKCRLARFFSLSK